MWPASPQLFLMSVMVKVVQRFADGLPTTFEILTIGSDTISSSISATSVATIIPGVGFTPAVVPGIGTSTVVPGVGLGSTIVPLSTRSCVETCQWSDSCEDKQLTGRLDG